MNERVREVCRERGGSVGRPDGDEGVDARGGKGRADCRVVGVLQKAAEVQKTTTATCAARVTGKVGNESVTLLGDPGAPTGALLRRCGIWSSAAENWNTMRRSLAFCRKTGTFHQAKSGKVPAIPIDEFMATCALVLPPWLPAGFNCPKKTRWWIRANSVTIF